MHISGVDSVAVLIGIGAEVKRRRQRLKLSQINLAKKAGVHPNVIGRLERGTYNPTVMILYDIAAALRSSMGDLMRRRRKGM